MLLAGVLSACGSSNDPAPETAAPVVAAPTTFAVSGTAATGAALDGATITITGSDGKTYPAAGEAPIVTGTDGSYTITLPLTAKPPFVVTAVRSDISLVSVIAEAKDSTANVTPVTNLIASRLSSSGDPAKLAAEFLADPTLLDLAKITASVAEVVKLIQPLMDAVGDSTNPLSGNIQLAVTNGTGADKMLDSLSISIVPSSDKTVNIAVSVKQQQAEGAQPVVIAFSGGTGATAPAATLPTVVATDLVDSGNAVLIADLLKRMTACYALPQADRVVSGGTVVVDIKATACKDMFVGNDAANYLNSGAKVSSTGAFAGLFGTGTGATFDLGSYEFTRGNGDWVIAYRLTASGNVSYNTLAVRVDTDKKLRVIGNQYKYNGGVNAYQQVRNFVAQPAADYYSTGYNLTVNNTADVADIVKVVVTSPSGKTLLLKRSAASSYFPIVKSDNTITGTSFVRLARQFLDTANTGDPALADLGTFFSTDRYAAADIIAIPAQARWKFEYFTDETTIDATQYYTTRARAMTIAELQTQPLANLPAADIAEAKSSIVSNTAGTTWWLPVDGTVDVDWEVPTGALAPTSIQVYGNYVTGPTTRSGFNDKTGVKSTDRKGTIPCSNGGSGDTHCDSAGNYATSDHFNGIHLWAQDATGRDFAHFYAFYKITLP
ncbi:MAG: hypothetical protein IH604_19275 [Burkholderiales bacterium]|nr:hypothetical protein [Burkholderiales bacterium]